MKTLGLLVKRNILTYIRDRAAVFFSLLSMFIVLMLMLVFLGKMNSDQIVSLLQEYGGKRNLAVDKANAEELIRQWTIAGILVVNSVTVPITMVGIMVNDKEKNKLQSFYVAPVSRGVIALGYILASMLVSTVICLLTLAISQGYIVWSGGTVLVWDMILRMTGVIIVNVFTYSSLMYLVALFTGSSSAWSGLATVVGTLVGFVGGIYLPMGFLPANVQNVLKCIPVLHGTSLMRSLSCQEILKQTFQGLPGQVSSQYKTYMGISIQIKEQTLNGQTEIVFLLCVGALLLAVATYVTRLRAVGDR